LDVELSSINSVGPKFSAEWVARMLLQTGAKTGPLHRQLSDGLAELIDRGELPPHAVLPPERSLAAVLTMSRTTVVAAYQTLREQGRVERRRGSGTSVCPAPGREPVSVPTFAGSGHTSSQFLTSPVGMIDLAAATLPGLDLVAEITAGISRSELLSLTRAHHGYEMRGLRTLRERIALWYSSYGLPTDADEILVTSGAQQAIELIARGSLQPGDQVIVEEPTYRGAMETFTRCGCRIRSVRMDHDGIDVRELTRVLSAQAPRLVYVQSSAHNPTGAVLSTERRHQLAALAASGQAVLVDDTSLAGTVFGGNPTPPALGSSENLLTIGSTSKLFWGGLRLGWIRATRRAVSRLAQVRGFSDLGNSLVTEEIALRLFDHYEAAVDERRQQLPLSLDRATALIEEHLPGWTWQQPVGGASLWVRLPEGDATHFAQVAQRFGVGILPGAVFSAAGEDSHTRLPFAIPAEMLRAGITALGQAWRTYLDRTTELPVISAAN
jgi:DNA-binding transcriptional MocR family regulator